MQGRVFLSTQKKEQWGKMYAVLKYLYERGKMGGRTFFHELFVEDQDWTVKCKQLSPS